MNTAWKPWVAVRTGQHTSVFDWRLAAVVPHAQLDAREVAIDPMPMTSMAYLTSPKPGAPQECSSAVSRLPGKGSGLRSMVVFIRGLLAPWQWQAGGPGR